MLKNAVLAILQEMGENKLLSGAMIRRRLDMTKPWLNPTEAELAEVLIMIHEEHGTASGIFSPDGEGHEFGIALDAKITAMPENCLVLAGVNIPGTMPVPKL